MKSVWNTGYQVTGAISRGLAIVTALCAVLFVAGRAHAAAYADSVVSYSAGTTATPGFLISSSAVGSPARFTADQSFPAVVSPFSPPFLASQLVSIGEGGQLTVRLSNYALPSATGPEIGIFGNGGLIDNNYPTGQTNATLSPSSGTFGINSVTVEVSEFGTTWVNLGTPTIDIPTNGYTDITDPFSGTAGSANSDFGLPFTGTLSSFANKVFNNNSAGDILHLLNGSGGGKWLDISATGLNKVGYIRLSVADDGNAGTSLSFNLDAVSVANPAVGAPTPEPGTVVLCGLGVMGLILYRRRQRT